SPRLVRHDGAGSVQPVGLFGLANTSVQYWNSLVPRGFCGLAPGHTGFNRPSEIISTTATSSAVRIWFSRGCKTSTFGLLNLFERPNISLVRTPLSSSSRLEIPYVAGVSPLSLQLVHGLVKAEENLNRWQCYPQKVRHTICKD